MNSKDRRKLAAETRKYCSIIKTAVNEYSEIISSLRDSEEEKMDNLPDNLQDGSLAKNIEEAITMLDEMDESITAIEEECSTVVDLVGIKLVEARR